jgi:hypothetical protein
MSTSRGPANDNEVQRDLRDHEDEVSEALARDSELDTDPESTMSLEQLDQQIERRGCSRHR